MSNGETFSCYIRYDSQHETARSGFLLLPHGSPERFTSRAQVKARMASLEAGWNREKLYGLWKFEVVAADTTPEVVSIGAAELVPQ